MKKFKVELALLIVIFIAHLFLRLYQFEQLNPFGWDQVDFAWISKNIIVDHHFPLLGAQAKLNSGIYIGPFYSYLTAIFYFFSNLDPVASGILAGVVSVFSFWTLFYITRKLFSLNVALIAVFLNAFSAFSVFFDRTQWSVVFVPSISLIIFFSLYKVLMGFPKYLLLLAISLGLMLHVHFTAIYFIFIVILSLPFFPRTKESLKYILIGLPLFFVWLIPIFIFLFSSSSNNVNVLHYGGTYYHGLHLRRMMQLGNDAFIQFEKFLSFKFLYPLKFILIPLFIFVYRYKSIVRQKLTLIYLILLWFLVPWVVLSAYKGEISDYYFAINSFIALFIIAYILRKMLEFRKVLMAIPVYLFLIFFAIVNIENFFALHPINLHNQRQEVLKAIREGKKIEFTQGDPKSYLYYLYTRNKK